MHILVDECVDPRVKRQFQQNLAKFKIGLVVVHVPKNQIMHYEAVQNALLLAVEQVRRGEVQHVRGEPTN
jgi:hypothetical protein